MVGDLCGSIKGCPVPCLIIVGQQAEHDIFPAPDVPIPKVVLILVGSDVTVGILCRHQFAYCFLHDCPMLLSRLVAVGQHRSGEPFSPEFGPEAPVAVRLVTERLNDPFDVLRHQPVLDAEVKSVADEAIDLHRTGRSRIQGICNLDVADRFEVVLRFGGDCRSQGDNDCRHRDDDSFHSGCRCK